MTRTLNSLGRFVQGDPRGAQGCSPSDPVCPGAGLGRGLLVHLGSINSNNWLSLLAFRERLIAGEVAPESSTSSVAPTAEASETAMVDSIRNAACRPISAAKKQQILSLEPTGMSAREIAVEVGVDETTVRATFRQAKQPPRRKRRFTETTSSVPSNSTPRAVPTSRSAWSSASGGIR